MKNITFDIPNQLGYQLRTHITLPNEQKPRAFALFAHCFSCNSSFHAVKNISKALAAEGIAVVRFDFTGLGNSEGNFSDSHFSGNVADLVTVNAYIAKNYQAPSILIGHSLGGAAAIVAAEKLDNIKAVATVGAPATVEHVTHLFADAIEEVKIKGEASVNIGGRPFTINQAFVENFSQTDLPAITKKLAKPILIMHSPIDTIVGIDNAHKIYHNAQHPKSFISLDRADHLLTKTADGVFAGKMIAAWASRVLPTTKQANISHANGEVVAHLNLIEDNFTTSVQAGHHHFLIDEPGNIGGDDFAASPYQYLLASIAACTTMTLKLYAERKKWDLQEVTVYLQKAEQNSSTEYTASFIKKITLSGDLTDEQKIKLKEIASRCPVHRAVAELSHFTTTLNT